MNIRQFIFTSISRLAASYPTPINLNFFWNLGSIAGLCIVIQLLSGIFLAMHYTPHIDLAFDSVESLMRNVYYGWLLRYIHFNGASLFFVIVYLHIFRGLYYGSYAKPTDNVWLLGSVLFLVLVIISFLGYVLPWGQMSFWGATVITNFISAIPYKGQVIILWIWGGFSVVNATLNRFYSLHYILPFVLAVISLLHLYALHIPKSNNPLGGSSIYDTIPFNPYYTFKDFLGFIFFFMLFALFVFFLSNVLGDPLNYETANPFKTPSQIVPEWYFLPFYTILRSIANKFLGVLAMLLAVLILMILPFIYNNKIKSQLFNPILKNFTWYFVLIFVVLTWVGGQHAEPPYSSIGQFATFYYFYYFSLQLPFWTFLENLLIKLLLLQPSHSKLVEDGVDITTIIEIDAKKNEKKLAEYYLEPVVYY